jgi:hypothetical protein
MNVAAHIFRGRREKLTFVHTSVNAASTSARATRRWICGARFSVPTPGAVEMTGTAY